MFSNLEAKNVACLSGLTIAKWLQIGFMNLLKKSLSERVTN